MLSQIQRLDCSIKIQKFSFNQMHLNISFAKFQPFGSVPDLLVMIMFQLLQINIKWFHTVYPMKFAKQYITWNRSSNALVWFNNFYRWIDINDLYIFLMVWVLFFHFLKRNPMNPPGIINIFKTILFACFMSITLVCQDIEPSLCFTAPR